MITPEIALKFDIAQRKLQAMGHWVLNPTTAKYQAEMNHHVNIEEKKWKAMEARIPFDRYGSILLYDLHMVQMADAVYMLTDWQESPGARSEYVFAAACRKCLLFDGDRMSDEILNKKEI